MKIKLTRFAGIKGRKRRPRPCDGVVRVGLQGLEIERHPEQRATWGAYDAANPEAWQARQVAFVYLSDEQRVELAAELLASVNRD